jgi:hypothetical protein
MENRRYKKFLQEQEQIDRMIKQGFHPIEIADWLIHITLEAMKEGFKNEFPEANNEELADMMRKQVAIYKKMKHYRRNRITD